MTAEQLEELLGKVTPEDKDGEWCPDMDYEGNFENQDDMKLSVLAPSLARRVIAAEAENDRLREILKENGIAQN